jgi:hypothetical protein
VLPGINDVYPTIFSNSDTIERSDNNYISWDYFY